MPTIPRGVRNNNPGNIDYNKANNWVGQLPYDPAIESRFCRFDYAENGIRALGKLLQTYFNLRGRKTVRAIITPYAPSNENNTGAYIATVAQRCGLRADDQIPSITDPKVLGVLMTSIIAQENANYAYPDAVFAEGLRRALA
jgi:hypothetical protein